MGLGRTLKQRALGLSQKAMERLFADERRAARIASALGTLQRGREALGKSQDTVLHQLNFASQSDFKALGKQLGALRRRVRALDERLSR
ncbi:MAG: hypothetical protein K1X89_09950 [Myxococcaceae bacterium]|nr:hypothetical protein [Myxococcaceae bacterium]